MTLDREGRPTTTSEATIQEPGSGTNTEHTPNGYLPIDQLKAMPDKGNAPMAERLAAGDPSIGARHQDVDRAVADDAVPESSPEPPEVPQVIEPPVSFADARGYGDAAPLYRAAGWAGVLPLRPASKVPHLAGWTGYDGAWPTDAQIAKWRESQPDDANLMLRVNYGLVGIDVDAYDAETGAQTLAEAQKRWGPLPDTYRSSSRSDDDLSGIRVYRVPEGVLFKGVIAFADLEIGDVEIIQPHHRHITAWPSIHPNGGLYRWYGPDGELLPEGVVPRVEDLPELPAMWVENLSRDAVREEVFDGSAPNRTAVQRTRINEELYQGLIALPDNGSPDRVVAAQLDRALEDLTSGTGSRYETMRDHVARLMRLHAVGRVGVSAALQQLYPAYVLEVGDTRPQVVAEAEFLRFTEGAAALVAASSPSQMTRDDHGDNGSSDAWGFTDGASFILDIQDQIPALWGEGDRVLWAEGESLMIISLSGVGKTTLANQLLSAQLGGIPGVREEVLGLPVCPEKGKILYLAMDRPAQIARSLRRQFSEARRDILREQLVVWPGPPPRDIALNPSLLAELAERAGASVVYVDSLKDAALSLSEEAVASGWNRARQLLLKKGVQLVELHHTRKDWAGDLSGVYGSTWLTAGAGSVVGLIGLPGDPIIGLRHLKQPATEVGPLRLSLDETTGTLSVLSGTDSVGLVKSAGDEGLTATEFASMVFDTTKPTKNETEKARRQLARLTGDGKPLTEIPGRKGGADGGTPTRWTAA